MKWENQPSSLITCLKCHHKKCKSTLHNFRVAYQVMNHRVESKIFEDFNAFLIALKESFFLLTIDICKTFGFRPPQQKINLALPLNPIPLLLLNRWVGISLELAFILLCKILTLFEFYRKKFVFLHKTKVS